MAAVLDLETFLRGMETMRGPPRRGGRLSLKPSLEGWKLHSTMERDDRPNALKPSLEGWKPCHFHHPSIVLETLETFLRGMETWRGGCDNDLSPP